MKKNLNFILLFLFFGMSVLKAQCDPIVWYHTADNKLVTANLTTGTKTEVCSNLTATGGSRLTDIGFAPDGKLYAVGRGTGDENRLFLINGCSKTTLTRTGSIDPGLTMNSLTFLPDGTALVGYSASTTIHRLTIINSTQYTLEDWYTPTGSSITGAGGDFILLGDMLYASMVSSSNNVIFEISIDENYAAISTLGSYKQDLSTAGSMFGMAAIYGKLYGGFTDKSVRELTLSGTTMSYSSNLLSSSASDEIFGMTSTQEALGQTNPNVRVTPTNGVICPGGGSVVLRSSVSSGNQWYRNGTLISGATGRTYTATSAGSYTVRITYGSGCFTDFSPPVSVTLSNLAISNQPMGADYCQSTTTNATPLSVASTGGTGGITYQWYRNNSNNTTTGTLISGATLSTYNPPITANGTTYYYAIVKRGTCEVTSSTARIVVTAKPATPVVASGSSLSNSCPVTTVNLTTLQPATVTGIDYEWHTVATNPTTTTKVGTPNAVSVSGIYYLYSKTVTGGCFSNASNAVTVNITPCPTCTNPTIGNQPIDATYCQNGTATALSVTATGTSLSYQWYRNTTNSTSGGTAVGTNSSTYTPIIGAITYHYYVIVSSGTCSTTSSVATINVTAKPTAPVASASTLSNSCPVATVNLTTLQPATVTGIDYEWHTVATNPTTTTKVGTPNAVSVNGTYYLYSKTTTGGCYSNASNAVIVTITPCATCTNSGVTSVDLTQLFTGTLPGANVVVEWWTSPTRDLPPTPGTKVLNPTNVTVSGTYYAFFYDTVYNCYNTDNSTASVVVNILPPCPGTNCTNPGSSALGGDPTKMGITVQQKQEGWPTNIPNGFIALQSQNKGMVITRVAKVGGGNGGAPDLINDSIKDPKEGMLVYDLAADCVKLFNGTIWKCLAKDCN